MSGSPDRGALMPCAAEPQNKKREAPCISKRKRLTVLLQHKEGFLLTQQ